MRNRSVCCAVSQSARATYEILRRASPTAITSATSIIAKFPSLHSNIMRQRHDDPASKYLPKMCLSLKRGRATELCIIGVESYVQWPRFCFAMITSRFKMVFLLGLVSIIGSATEQATAPC